MGYNSVCLLERNPLCHSASCHKATYNVTECDEVTYVDCRLDKQMLYDNCALGMISFLLMLIFLVGVVGNVCVCLVIWKQSSILRTPTNYYLFSLAVSDMFILADLPYVIFYMWRIYPDILGLGVCRTRVAIAEIGTYASVLTVVAFSIERYIAVCHPLLTASKDKLLKRAVIVINCIWLICIACAIPLTLDYAILPNTEYPPYSGKYSSLSTSCRNHNLTNTLSIYLKVTTALFFFLPMTILLAMYVQIGICIWKRRKQSSVLQGQSHSEKGSGRERITFSVLSTVVVAFLFCWFPFHILRLISPEYLSVQFYKTLYFTAKLKFLFATFNPILYSVMSLTYRRAFKDVLIPLVKYRSEPNKVRINTKSKTTSFTNI